MRDKTGKIPARLPTPAHAEAQRIAKAHRIATYFPYENSLDARLDSEVSVQERLQRVRARMYAQTVQAPALTQEATPNG